MKIALLGDVALFGKNTYNNFEDFKKRTKAIKSELDKCDYVVANLETPLTNEKKVVGGKSAYIKGSPDDIELLKYLGVTHVSLANNHSFDYRAKGLIDTIKTLKNAGIKWYGVNGKSVLIKSSDGILDLHGYCCYSANARGMEGKKLFVSPLDPEIIEQDITRDKKNGYIPILSCHWGQEHVHYPNYDHIEVARTLCKNQEVIIHGHHPHVIQGIERIDNSLIAYSLGNFCFDDVYTSKSKLPLIQLTKDNKESFIFIIEIGNKRISSFEILPFSFENEYYEFDTTINANIEAYNNYLNLDKNKYIQLRNLEISNYIYGRKKLRNLEWYLKRLNYESVKMIVNSRKDSIMYNRYILSFLNRLTNGK